MATLTFGDIENGFLYVSMAMQGMNTAVLCKATGEIHFHSELVGDGDTADEEGIDWDQCIGIPHKNELNMGRDLVFDFVEEYLPDAYEQVRRMFRRAGAYSEYKCLLARRGLLEQWHDVERCRVEEALRRWCRENDIELTE